MKIVKLVYGVIGGLFSLAGVILTVAALMIWQMDAKMMAESVAVEGVYTEVTPRGTEITFEAEGREWTVESTVYSSSMRVGDPVEIWYRPGNPGMAQMILPALWMGLLGGGCVFLIIGGTFLLILARNAVRRRSLFMNGVRVTAQVTQVGQNFAVRINGRHPYVIRAVCTHPYTGQEMKVKSGFFMHDPSGQIQNGQIDVLVDPMRDKRYHMLTEELQ